MPELSESIFKTFQKEEKKEKKKGRGGQRKLQKAVGSLLSGKSGERWEKEGQKLSRRNVAKIWQKEKNGSP